jgi:hypothetical protein
VLRSIFPCDELNLDPILVKIDVEGSELQVLKGMSRTLKKHHPVIIAENCDSVDEIISFLKNFNYKPINPTTMVEHSRETIKTF